MFLCDLSFAGFIGPNTKTEVTRRASYPFVPSRLRCKRGGELLLSSLRIAGKEQLATGVGGIALFHFADGAFPVRLHLPEIQGRQLVVLTLENRSDAGTRFQLELGRST